MAQQTFFSPIMPFAMRPEELNRPSRYHSGHLDTDWQKDLIEPFQMDYEYAQKVELGDPFRFQAKTTSGLSAHVDLFLLDCAGRKIYTIPHTNAVAVANDLTADGTQYYTYQFSYPNLLTLPSFPGGGAVPEGTYYLLFSVEYTASTAKWISEPIEIAARHEGTMLVEYSNSTYKEGVPFNTVPVLFRLRFEAYVSQMVPKSASTVYQDQDYDTLTLDFHAYRTWTLFIGQSGDGVPYWLIDKLNRILGMDNILLDGKKYTPAGANPAWTIDGPETTPLKAASVEIQEAQDAEDFTSPVTSVALYTSPGYPYAVGTIDIGARPSWHLSGPARIADSTAETAYIATLNANLQSFELLGTVTKVGSTIQYNNGPGENFQIASTKVFTTKYGFTFTPSVNPYLLSFSAKAAEGVVVWGDGTIERLHTTAASATAVPHTYPSAASYTVEIWGFLTEFNLATSQPSGLSGLTGTLASNMGVLTIANMLYFGSTFNAAFLAPAAAALKTIALNVSGITTVTNLTANNFPLLKTVSFSGNSLTTTEMNNIIINVKNNAVANSITGGFLNVAGQTPAVSINAGGSAARTTLQSMGWTVLV